MKTNFKSSPNIFSLFALLASLLGGALTVTPAYAEAGIVVDTNADTYDVVSEDCASVTIGDLPGEGDGLISLREAMCAASNTAGTDTITFAANYTITLGSQLPAVTTTIIINGNGAANSIIQANAAANTATYRVFQVVGNLTLDSLTARHGVCNGACSPFAGYGGGIFNQGTLTVTNSTLLGNSSALGGGGIYNGGNGGTSTVTNSTLSGNDAELGGGIMNDSTTTVTNSTLSGNSGDYGGGIFSTDTLAVTNSTLSGNSALHNGGGIQNTGSTVTVTNSTLSGNSGGATSGINNNNGTLNYANTIIANSASGTDCVNNATIGTNTNNLVEDNSCSPFLNGDPNLGALADNGGATQTHALLSPSIAIDAGDATICANAPVNNASQNGVTRPQGTACDIGSFELSELVFSNGFE